MLGAAVQYGAGTPEIVVIGLGQFSVDAGLHQRTKMILTYPQYWSYRLTGIAATDISSLGCHTDLWNPFKQQLSTLVDKLDIAERIAPAYHSGDVLGSVLPTITEYTGLQQDIPVVCGIHDSNVSLYPYIITRKAPFTFYSGEKTPREYDMAEISKDTKFRYLHPADQIVMIMQRIYRYEMTTTSGGNISIRDSDGSIWISPRGVDKGRLTRDDIVCISAQGETRGKHQPSSEYPFHKAIYDVRDDINAILHAHPPALVSFSASGRVPNLKMLPNVHKVCGKVDFVTYGLPGSDDLGAKIADSFANGYDTALLENHGVVTAADTVFEAFKQFESLDFTARIEIKASVLGKIRHITDAEFEMYNTRAPQLETFVPEQIGSTELALRQEMCDLIQRSYDQGLFTSTDGTFAARLDESSFLISPYNYDRHYIRAEDIVLVRDGRREENRQPSRSVRLLQKLFACNRANAIVIAHAPNLMAFNVTSTLLNSRVIPEAYILLRDIQTIPFEAMISDHQSVCKALTVASPIAMVQNNGIIVTGGTLLEAFDRLEVAEYTAKAVLGSWQLGKVNVMNDEIISELVEAFGLPN